MKKPNSTLPKRSSPGNSLEDQAYRQLRQALVDGNFIPGQKLSIRRIASELGTSPMPVRTALGRLIAEQALDVLPSGTAVVPRLTRKAFEQLGLVRAALEPLAVKLAGPNIDTSTREKLGELLKIERMAREAGDSGQLLRADRQFLFTLYEPCQAPILMAMIEATWLRRSPHFWGAQWLIIGRLPSGSKHADILGAIDSGDFDYAGDLIKAEIQSATSYLLERMSFIGDPISAPKLRPLSRGPKRGR
ncbi:GntR family transcriptional regulator [Mesorhizobium sp.]|uniref:GntR family transcriptional regulator n=1 Tax=Mesorhizobium sp. TaxID=1871066 RepID=UPI000FE9003F|nr:GntR family transcriptional regulator [Mesorhizobium sp.]RWO52588.1 MAG: GntR family transcriptional regulator [Mesorhizobium sp.]TIL48507.1 MAG: GntR family transcriptional regulator [Mesorhizobium sp.]